MPLYIAAFFVALYNNEKKKKNLKKTIDNGSCICYNNQADVKWTVCKKPGDTVPRKRYGGFRQTMLIEN